MLQRANIITLTAALLAGCGAHEANHAVPQTEANAVSNAFEAPGPVNSMGNEAAAPVSETALPPDAGKLPPIDRSKRFKGKWALTLAQCSGSAWWIGDNRIEGLYFPDGGHCGLNEISGSGSHYSAIAWCAPDRKMGGMEDGYRIEFNFNDKAQTMTVTGPGFPNTGLVYCGSAE